jgi:hypothetical protein
VPLVTLLMVSCALLLLQRRQLLRLLAVQLLNTAMMLVA